MVKYNCKVDMVVIDKGSIPLQPIEIKISKNKEKNKKKTVDNIKSQ